MPQLLADIDTYLDGIGLKQYRNINQFWSYMDSRYSRTQVCELEKSYMKLERGDDEGFYSDIFQNLKTSLDFCSLRRDLYRSYLTWFLENMMPPPAVMVDAGCGNGILTCFYAKHFRESRVIGFDSSEQGIECAKELAQQVGCKNVEFVVSDFNKPSLPVEKGEVELITSVASLRSGSEMNGGISIYALLSQAKQSRQKSTIKALEPYLNPKSGCLISFDKVSNISQQISWASEIQAAGLGVDLRKSSWIAYQNVESDTVTLPAIYAEKGRALATNDDLLSFFISQTVDLSEFVLDFGKEALAELAFSYVNPKQFLRGARATYHDGSGIYWHELWQAGPFILVFEHTNQGFRALRIAPSMKASDLRAAVDQWIEQTSNYADVVEIEAPEINFDVSQL